jgi:serine/threonine protein kinase
MRLGPYELVRQIGAGGMGEVWAAHRSSAPREVIAVKRLPKALAGNPAYRKILLEEARLSMLLRHRNLVHVFDAGEAGGEAYIAMEFVHGLDLSRLRRLLDHTGEALSPTLVAYVIGEVLAGLAYAHNLEHDGELLALVHRDVSPHNVMLSTRGEVKLTDFGVARLSTEDTSGTHVKGKARYMPPEQLRGQSRSPKVDLFAVGAVLHELLDGAVFRGDAKDDARLLGMAIDGVVPAPRRSLASLGALEQLRRGLLEVDPRQRIATAEDALALLRRFTGYRNASAEIGDLVRRYLDLAGSLDEPAAGGLGHQATELHGNDDAIGLEELDAIANIGTPDTFESSFGDVAPGPDLLGPGVAPQSDDFEFQLEDEVPRPAPSRPLAWDEGAGEPDAEPARPRKRKRPPSTANARPAGLHIETAYDPGQVALEPSYGGPGLELDLGREPVVRRPPPTRPTTPVPKRSYGKLVLGVLAVAGVAAAVVSGAAQRGLDWLRAQELEIELPTPKQPDPEPEQVGMRKARVIGVEQAGYVGFHARRMDLLATNDILYSFVPAGEADPLEALAVGEAEFAVTTLDRFLAAHGSGSGAPGKIVAVVQLSLGGEALVIDSVEFPGIRTLGELAPGLAEPPHSLAHARGTTGEHLDARLGSLLLALDQPGLQHVGEFEDVRAVYEALAATTSSGTPVVAGWLREPYLGQAIAAGMTVAISTRDLPDASVHVLIASTRTLAEHPELVSAVVSAYYEGIVAQKDLELISATAGILGISIEEAGRAHAGLCLLDAIAAEAWLVARGRPPLLEDATAATWSTLLAEGAVTGAAPQTDVLLDARAMTAAATQAREAGGPSARETCLATPTGSGPSVALGELRLPINDGWFVDREATLTDTGIGSIHQLAATLRSFNEATITAEVEAHGDGKRSLGQKRAEAVVAALQRADAGLSLRARGSAKLDRGSLRIVLTRAP